MADAPPPSRSVVRPAEDDHKVTTLELFFDLVFVFAITQVTGYLAHHLNPMGFVEGLVLLALIWWAWVAYAWLGTTIRFDEGLVRIILFTVMAMLLIISMGLPEAFEDEPGGFHGWLSTPTVVALAYGAIRVLHIALYLIAAKDNPELRAAVGRFSAGVGVSVILLVIGSFQHGWAQVALYATAALLDIVGAFAGGGKGWAVNPGHFAERHGLIVIIALGESIVAIGAGAADLPLSWPIVVTATLGLMIAVSLWWIYFDITALAAERNLVRLQGPERSRAARDAYSILHFPMVAGIVLVALGVKKAMALMGEEPLQLAAHVKPIAAVALPAGVGLYLVGHLLFRRRLAGSWSQARVVAAAVCLALAVAAPLLPTMAVLVALVVLLIALVNHEHRRMGWLAERLRHSGHGDGAHADGKPH